VISGGQSGVDRAALDAGRAAGIPRAGWCPRHGWAEDLPDPPGVRALHPELRETPAPDPAQRTRWNVRDADATLVLVAGGPHRSPGTALTVEVAQRAGRPIAVVDLDAPDAHQRGRAFLEQLPDGARLNVAGPRESECPGIHGRARELLGSLLAGPAPVSDPSGALPPG
jgi:hypothetical protein